MSRIKTKIKSSLLIFTLLTTLLVPTMVTPTTVYATEAKNDGIFTEDFNVGSDGTVTSAADDTDSAFEKIIDKYKGIITFVSGIGAITMIGIFIFNFIKLGQTATNPSERSKVLTGLIWSGIAAAGLGSVALIVGVFYGLLGD